MRLLNHFSPASVCWASPRSARRNGCGDADYLRPRRFDGPRNNAKGKSGELCAGWGTPLADYFDPAKVAVANVAHAGTSSRSYFNNPGDWPKVVPQIKAGDFVLLVFGINDGAAPPVGRGSLPGVGDETVEVKRPDGTIETAHTYGWYMSTMATLAREARGAGLFSDRDDPQHLDEPEGEV